MPTAAPSVRQRPAARRLTGQAFTVALAVALALPAVVAEPAFSATDVRVKWRFATSTHLAGATATVVWSVRNAPRGSQVVLQRTFGTAEVFKAVKVLDRSMQFRRSAGRAVIRVPAMGVYRYRAKVIAPSGVRSRGRERSLWSFGAVPLSQLCERQNGCKTGEYVAGGVLFGYSARATDYKGSNPVFAFESNTCMSVHLDWVPGQTNSGQTWPGQVGILLLTQESRDPVGAQTPMDTISSLDARLVPGRSWWLNLDQSGGNRRMRFYLAGSALCYTPDGRTGI
jgi:hypothetical protein